MPLAYIRPVGANGLYHVHVLDAVDPGFGNIGGGADPGYGRPEWGDRPSQGLPGHGHPGNRPPGSGPGGIPDHDLPDHPPPTLAPGYTIVMVRGPHGKWEYAFVAPGDPPPKPLPPGSIEHPGNRPPGSGMPPHVGGGPIMPQPPHIGGGPMPGQPPVAGNPLPPTGAPKPV